MKLLEQFFVEQFRECAKSKSNRGSIAKYEHKINSKLNLIRNTHAFNKREDMVAEIHKDVRRLANSAYYHKNKKAIAKINNELIPELVRLNLEMLEESEADAITEAILSDIKKEAKLDVCYHSFAYVYHKVMNDSLKQQIVKLVPARPELEFVEAQKMERHFVLHIGPTNSGKTYNSLLKLKDAGTGVYLGPLRLLALEVFEKMREYGTPATMLTGQECIAEEGSRVTASTVEMLDLSKVYDVAVIDEAQMVADELRGHCWTRAILGVRAKEIHVCMSPDAENVVKHLISLTNDTYETFTYERKTALELEDKPFSFPEDVRDGDALIVFSKKAVLNVAGRLEEEGIASSVIYGSLPPEIRRRQMHMFNAGETKVVVSTDAIGMGLNLPVKRIVFMEVEKYDGKKRRPLELTEIKQIAGRAGRFGRYETGYVTALDERRQNYLRKMWKQELTPITRVSLGFPQVLLDMKAPLDVILKLWHDEKPEPPFEKISIEEMLFLYKEAYNIRMFIPDFDDREILYRLITCPLDIKDNEIVRLWGEYCMNYTADISLEKPRLASRYKGLQKYESYYRKLDLYYQLSMRLGKLVDETWLEEEREKTQEHIMDLLSMDKHEFILRCKYCGRVLPVDLPFRLCDRCKNEMRSYGYRY